MMDFQFFSNLFNKTIFDTSKADLLIKIGKYPDRYIGLFRPTKPKAKLLQNLLQSNEIRFGDAFEKIMEEYFILHKYEILDKHFSINYEGEITNLLLDQLIKKGSNIVFIEQKIRDDHDSTKKRGQINNFEIKLNEVIKKYGDKNITAYFYFIDPSLNKNKNYYTSKLEQITKDYEINCILCYGKELFESLDIKESWDEILKHLKKWKDNIQELPETNFDLDAISTFNKIKNLPPKVFLLLFKNDEIKKQILPIIFPNNKTLILINKYFSKKEEKVYKNISIMIEEYIKQKI